MVHVAEPLLLGLQADVVADVREAGHQLDAALGEEADASSNTSAYVAPGTSAAPTASTIATIVS